jgi:tetratricopeptide (TPR) repeat protein
MAGKVLGLLLAGLTAAWLSACGGDEGRAGGEPVTAADTARLRSVLRSDPTNAALRLRLAERLAALGRRGEAVGLLTEGIAVDSGAVGLWNARSLLLAELGDTSAALAGWSWSLRLEPGQREAWLELGFLHAGRGDVEAADIARRLLRGSRDAEERLQAWHLTGVYHANRGEAAAAIAAFDSCMLLRYTFLDAYIEKGILLQGEGRHREALATFRLASTVDKSNPDAWHGQAGSLEALGELPAAADAYARALALDTSLRAARRGLERTAAEGMRDP